MFVAYHVKRGNSSSSTHLPPAVPNLVGGQAAPPPRMRGKGWKLVCHRAREEGRAAHLHHPQFPAPPRTLTAAAPVSQAVGSIIQLAGGWSSCTRCWGASAARAGHLPCLPGSVGHQGGGNSHPHELVCQCDGTAHSTFQTLRLPSITKPCPF